MNYKNFENDNFRQDLKKDILKFDITNAPLSKFNTSVICSSQASSKQNEIYTSKQLSIHPSSI